MTVVGNEIEGRDAVVNRGPQAVRVHEVVAVAEDGDRMKRPRRRQGDAVVTRLGRLHLLPLAVLHRIHDDLDVHFDLAVLVE